MFRTTLAFWH